MTLQQERVGRRPSAGDLLLGSQEIPSGGTNAMMTTNKARKPKQVQCSSS